MPLLIFALSMHVAAIIQRYLQAYAPSNLLVAHVRRNRPRLRVAAALLTMAGALMLGALVLSEWAASGGPGWLHLLVLNAVWDCMKFAVLALAVLLRGAAATLRKVSARTKPTVQEVCVARKGV